jgi:hypothetical protein
MYEDMMKGFGVMVTYTTDDTEDSVPIFYRPYKIPLMGIHIWEYIYYQVGPLFYPIV